MTLRQAVEWCRENEAEIAWQKWNGKDYVSATKGPVACMESTFERAVETLSLVVMRVYRKDENAKNKD